MNTERHKELHRELHESLDELVADFILHTGITPGGVTIKELMNWSYLQTIEPS